DEKSTLKVVHKHGPCSPHKQHKVKVPSHEEILRLDQARVDSIHSKISNSIAKSKDSATLPATYGAILGTGNYIATVGFGTPKKDFSLELDTGSDLTWIQCLPCVRFCYRQLGPIFNPSKSSSYKNISCNSATCKTIVSGTGNEPGCLDSTCLYGIEYGDGSFTVGYLAKDTLAITFKYKFPNIVFGCGQYNEGSFGLAAGLLGLGRDKVSIVSQTEKKFKGIFSYCLPSFSSSTGYLTFGYSRPLPSLIQYMYTPFGPLSYATTFYGVIVIGIKVGGSFLPISPLVFSCPGTIFDSGTVITRLPPAAYSALRTAFREEMSEYPTAPAYSIFDTCYNISAYSTVSVPTISIYFANYVEMPIAVYGILYVFSPALACLAFVGNSNDSDLGIIGNYQQQTLGILYNNRAYKIGIATNGCN
ncbi:Asp domain-containing protein, partial [Cephalotus follicularis]